MFSYSAPREQRINLLLFMKFFFENTMFYYYIGNRSGIMNKKSLNKLFTVAAICMSAIFARVSDSYTSADIVFGMKSFSSKPFVSSDLSHEDQENSLKWKRRHKRRKKAPNRKPQRGK